MQFAISINKPNQEISDCLIVGVFENQGLTSTAAMLDKVSNGYISQILQQGDLKGKSEQTLLLHYVPHITAKRILLVGCGKEEETLTNAQYERILISAFSALKNTEAKSAVCYLTELLTHNNELFWKIRLSVTTAGNVFYAFNQLKQEPKKSTLNEIKFYANNSQHDEILQSAIKQGRAIVAGMDFTRDLGNLPANICTPTYLANEAKKLTSYKKIKVTILDEKQAKKLGMNTFLSVAKGSDEPPQFIVIEYQGADKATKPVVLVGKGVTFDSGGISIKPSENMDEMKFDMCGAGSVLGTIKAIGELELPINVVGLIVATENLPSGKATKPGDVVKSMSGQTVEILNTDAEGRLILSDALTYAEQYEPKAVIDIATLTGAIIIALGYIPSGLFTADETLAKAIEKAADETFDRVWRLPLWEDYQPYLATNFADMANISNTRGAGSITAACFLSRFTKKYPWAHLDIAGTAWKSGKEKGASGRPVPLLVQYLINVAKQT